MGVTRFPNGIRIGSEANGTAQFDIGATQVHATAAELNKLSGAAGVLMGHPTSGRQIFAGTVIVGATGSTAFVPTGATTVLFAVASPYGPLVETAGTVGGFTNVAASVGSGGTVTIRAYDQMGTASSYAGTAAYLIVGT